MSLNFQHNTKLVGKAGRDLFRSSISNSRTVFLNVIQQSISVEHAM